MKKFRGRSRFLVAALTVIVCSWLAASGLAFADEDKPSYANPGGQIQGGGGSSGPGGGNSNNSPNYGNSHHGSGNSGHGNGGQDSERKEKSDKNDVSMGWQTTAGSPTQATAPGGSSGPGGAPSQSASGSQSNTAGPAPSGAPNGAASISDMIKFARQSLSKMGAGPQVAAQMKQLDELEKMMANQKMDPNLMGMLAMLQQGGASDPNKVKAMMESMQRGAAAQPRVSSAGQAEKTKTAAQALALQGAISEPAAKKLLQALSDVSSVVDLKMPASQTSVAKRDPKEVLADATRKLDANPKDYQSLADRAEALNDLEDYTAAEAEATKALLLEPRLIRALNARAFAYNKRGQHSLALQDVEVVLGQEPDNAFAHLNRALAFDGLNRIREALLEYELAAQLDDALGPFYRDAVRRHGGRSGPETAEAQSQPAPQQQPLLSRDVALVALGVFAAACFGFAFTRGNKAPPAPHAEKHAAVDSGVGAVLGGNYRLDSQLGEGGMGVVFEGTDMTLQRKVAIKKMRGDMQQDAADVEMFLQEARLVAGLKHPSLVEIYAVLQENEEIYLVFEHLAGRPLDKLIATKGRLTPPEVLHIIAEVGKGLDYAHSKKVIHRDLKPGNIMITNEGGVKIMDFGIAHRARVSATKFTSAMPCGTVFYMPPEQELGSVSLESDLYALGVMTYEMLTGEVPFVGPNFLEQKTKGIYTAASVKGLPAAVDGVLTRALDQSPGQRYHSAAEFAQDLNVALTEQPLSFNGGYQPPANQITAF